MTVSPSGRGGIPPAVTPQGAARIDPARDAGLQTALDKDHPLINRVDTIHL